MGSLPAWMPVLIERLNWGCSASPWFADLAVENRVLERGRKIIFDLWPYIRELPLNITSVRGRLPERMISASQLLNKLGDNERHYQRLFLQQFDLAGIDREELKNQPLSPRTQNLCALMNEHCQRRDFTAGVHAIVAAELAATMYCRSALASYESYFDIHADEYEPELISNGLEWVRLHAKTHTRHAILMKRMLDEIGFSKSAEIPESAQAILDAVLMLWECPQLEPVG